MEPSQDNIRKRVCKACDRCRLKKSKCDGANPCSRCKTDNAICVFGERKKSQDKVYPKGYVEMLEQQQGQLVAGLRELYSRCLNGDGWPGRPLQNLCGGHPLTHDILERLDLLHPSSDGSSTYDEFEEDPNRMQEKLVKGGAPYTHRRGSVSSDEDHGRTSSSSSSSHSVSPPTKSLTYSNPRNYAPPTPPLNSSFTRLPEKQNSSMNQPIFSQALEPAMQHRGVDPTTMMDGTMFYTPNSYAFGDFETYPALMDCSMSLGSDGLFEPPVPEMQVDYNHFLQNVS